MSPDEKPQSDLRSGCRSGLSPGRSRILLESSGETQLLSVNRIPTRRVFAATGGYGAPSNRQSNDGTRPGGSFFPAGAGSGFRRANATRRRAFFTMMDKRAARSRFYRL
jgi:hypothetical protein